MMKIYQKSANLNEKSLKNIFFNQIKISGEILDLVLGLFVSKMKEFAV
jgi:hypothetical protein